MKLQKEEIKFYFGQNFRYIRNQLGWSRVTMSRKIEISMEAIMAWEKKGQNASLTTLVILSDYFGLSLDELLLVDMEKEGLKPIIDNYKPKTEQ
jgi:transcriptional regulator with XRE-family HTH domain